MSDEEVDESLLNDIMSLCELSEEDARRFLTDENVTISPNKPTYAPLFVIKEVRKDNE